MRENWVYRRGDVYLADCGEWRGSIQGGIRPVVVMQNNTGNRHSPTLCVVKLTSKVKKKPNQPTHYTLKNVRGIPYPSQVLAEQPDTINKSDIIRYMAHLSDRHMVEISRCLEVELALGSDTPDMRSNRAAGDAAKNDTGTSTTAAAGKTRCR
ncbi:MAG: type II toxin-antitoxin system PemK/MazF family toxin [Clostridiales bacterium]|nr:type II toxin-antitoxin system PemK/MazF family toxin [Clostridiales bacterium]